MTTEQIFAYAPDPFNITLFLRDLNEFKTKHKLKWKVAAAVFGITQGTLNAIRYGIAFPKVEVVLNACVVMGKDPMSYLGNVKPAALVSAANKNVPI